MITAIKVFILRIVDWIKYHFPKKKRVINIIFRYDDFSAVSRTDFELSILEICRKNHIKFTFAVIPSIVEGDIHEPGTRKLIPLSEEKAEILKNGVDQGLIDIALHGYSHQTNNSAHFSEFAGLDYHLQLQKIIDGKNILENITNSQIKIFAPPWNSYDTNTLSALEKSGFSVLTAGRDGTMLKNTKLKIVPSTCSLRRLRSAVQDARTKTSINQPIIVVLFHEFEIIDIDKERGIISFQEFSDLISWLSSQADIRILSIGQSTKAIKGLGAKRFLSMKNPTSGLYY